MDFESTDYMDDTVGLIFFKIPNISILEPFEVSKINPFQNFALKWPTFFIKIKI